MDRIDKFLISSNIVLYFLIRILGTEHVLPQSQACVLLSVLASVFIVILLFRFCCSYFKRGQVLYRILFLVLIDMALLFLSIQRGLKDLDEDGQITTKLVIHKT